jgi:putative membrane protein
VIDGRGERLAGGAAVLAMLLTPFARRGGAVRRGLTAVTVIAGASRSIAADVRRHGTSRALLVGAATAVGTWSAEALGVRSGRIFGRYVYTAALRPQLAGVPVLVPLAWVAMAAPSHSTAAAIATGRSRRIGAGAVALTAWDLFLDPQMIGEGYWRWLRGGRYRGIPLANFAGWLAVAAAVMAVREIGLGDDDGESQQAGHVDLANVATYGVVALMETAAFATFLRDRTVAIAGGAVMLPLAGTALVGAARR